MDLKALAAAHPEHWSKATAIRALTLDAVAAANSGHSGMPIGMADAATVLFEKHLKFDPTAPNWPDRDRFILSAGHGSMLLYSLLHLTGYEDMTLEQIKNFRQWGAITAGHPEYGHATGIETTTGPLGQGISNAVGFAMAEEIQRARYGKKVVDHYTYVVAGDGCLMEGVSQEAITLAGRHQLSKLIVLWDNNNITIDGPVTLSDRTDQVGRFLSCGWEVIEIDGHDPVAIDEALTKARKSAQPSMIACKTHIALGHAAQDTSKGHGALTNADQNADAKTAWGWTTGPFEVPADVLAGWKAIGARGKETREAWEERFDSMPRNKRESFNRAYALEAPKKLSATIKAFKKQMSEAAPKIATRASSEKVLEVINPIMPETVGGSADLTGSNNTKTGDLGVFDTDNRGGRYVYWGIREHGMAAAMNGMALHGGVRPYGGTFMCFTDYARPSMRLAALMQIPTVFVMTHDSIGLGEDGPTHQPVEHLAISRATPNTYVFRPADTIETAEAWELALTSKKTPSVLSLHVRVCLPSGQNTRPRTWWLRAHMCLLTPKANVRPSLWQPARKSRLLWRQETFCRPKESARALFPCPAGSSLKNRSRPTANAYCQAAPFASRLRQAFAKDGTAGCLANVGVVKSPALSECTALGPPRPPERSTRNSALQPKPQQKKFANC